MKRTPEQEAELTLNSLDGLLRAEAPDALEEKLFARFRRETARTPKWFWAAAAVLLLVNLGAAWKYLGKETTGKSSIDAVAGYYFQGGSSWYNEN